ncbi:hypothetical protein M011DRAFT_457347 [Sporormia fimetaria CBS 119925]|uniref:Nuclear rim protein 1 n=1 Tax=Sporormia fimetaria CBS 119925 TaxID=1340428 RepID=A0A6A6VDB5_9PLEO|nr:hypothetical protein M011DRAFT_457347 [Sporormia fimetaria CBS 119925]
MAMSLRSTVYRSKAASMEVLLRVWRRGNVLENSISLICVKEVEAPTPTPARSSPVTVSLTNEYLVSDDGEELAVLLLAGGSSHCTTEVCFRTPTKPLHNGLNSNTSDNSCRVRSLTVVPKLSQSTARRSARLTNMPPVIRKAPLTERIKNYLDPVEWFMWASEELNSSDWDEFASNYATSIGFGANLVYIFAQANTGRRNTVGDDVFGEPRSNSSGWLRWFLNLVVLILSGLSFLNAFYTFYKKRHYRLFEQPIETSPSTPSAHRVRVDSSPMTATPLRILQNIIGDSAESRAYPDAGRDVWEIALWDPNPLCLRLFCLFSPLHVILYWANLPVAPLESRPSVKVVSTIALAILLSLQLNYVRKSFVQQIKDSAIIHREVLNEYDTKFVHPSLQRPYRDVGIQTITKKSKYRDSGVGPAGSDLASEVDTYTPTTFIKRGFQTHPNAAYASQYDPDNLSSQPTPRASRSTTPTPSFRPLPAARYTSASTATTGTDFSSPIRPSNTPNPFRQPRTQLRSSHVGSGDGGSLGVFSHAASPLRKSASANYLREDRDGDSLGSMGERRAPSPTKREGSPLKRMSTPAGFNPDARTSGLSNRFNKGYSGLGVGRRESGGF